MLALMWFIYRGLLVLRFIFKSHTHTHTNWKIKNGKPDHPALESVHELAPVVKLTENRWGWKSSTKVSLLLIDER